MIVKDHSKGEEDRTNGQEREMNNRHVVPSRPHSSRGSHSPVGFGRTRTNSLTQPIRENLTSVAQSSHRLLHYHSSSNLTHVSSAARHSHASQDARDESQEEDIAYERERNWNAPRKKRGPHEHDSDSLLHPPSSPSHPRAYPNGHTEEGLPKTRIIKGDRHQTTVDVSAGNISDMSSRLRTALSSNSQTMALSGRASPTSTSQQSTSNKQNEAYLRSRPSTSRSMENNDSGLPIVLQPSTAHNTVPPAFMAETKLPGKGYGVSSGSIDRHAEKPFEGSHTQESRSVEDLSRRNLSYSINGHYLRIEGIGQVLISLLCPL